MSDRITRKLSPAPDRGRHWIAKNFKRYAVTIADEFRAFHFRLWIVNAFLFAIPPFVGPRLRRTGLRFAGFHVGPRCLFYGMPTISGTGNIYERLRIGEDCNFNTGCTFDLADKITIGNRVDVGHQLLIVTGTHRIGPGERRMGKLVTAPVIIGDGVWIGARVTILPGVTVGPGAVIGAGATVREDVPADTMVSGSAPFRSVPLRG